MVTLILADDHPVFASGLRAVFEAEPDIVVQARTSRPVNLDGLHERKLSEAIEVLVDLLDLVRERRAVQLEVDVVLREVDLRAVDGRAPGSAGPPLGRLVPRVENRTWIPLAGWPG